jgi:nicotinamide riboside kinase
VQETEVCSFDVAETVLGHMVAGKVERAYARSGLLDQRRLVMEKWAAHVTGQESVVVPLRRGG